MPKIIPIVFHNGSNYDYYFIIKKLGEEFKKRLTCLGEKCITFTIPIEKKVTRIDKNGDKKITYYCLLIAQDLWQAYYQI